MAELVESGWRDGPRSLRAAAVVAETGAVLVGRTLEGARTLLPTVPLEPGTRVLSIGGVSWGGDGKSPLARHVARRLADRGLSVTVVMRGYGGRIRTPARVGPGHLIDRRGDVARFGDEAVMMASTLEAEAHVWAGPLERCLGRAARERPDAIVVDDGLGLPRRPGNVSIALLSADRLCHRRLPAGPLRRPLADTARADVVGIRVGDGPGSPTSVEGRASELLAAASADRPWFAFRLRPVGDGRGARVYLASGIANVERFRRSAEQVRYTVVGRTWFPDHHLPSRRDLGDLEEAARSRAAHAILVTAKDAPRFPPSLGPLPVRVLETTVQLIRNSHVLEGAIEELCAGQGG